MATVVKCNKSSELNIQKNITVLLGLIKECRWVIDAYVSDFYTHCHWEKLPGSVQEYFDQASCPDLAWILSTDTRTPSHSCCRVVPLSLLALQCCVQTYSLRRTAVDLDVEQTLQEISSALSIDRDGSTASEAEHCIRSKQFQAPHYKNGQCMDMQHIFRKHVKPKKQHEIQKLGQAIRLVSEVSGCRRVVDVGAGLGHLSRLLSFQHDLKVTTVEAADGHAPKAATYDREMRQEMLKKRKREDQTATMKVKREGSASDMDTDTGSTLSGHLKNQETMTDFSEDILHEVSKESSSLNQSKDASLGSKESSVRSKEPSKKSKDRPVTSKGVSMESKESSNQSSEVLNESKQSTELSKELNDLSMESTQLVKESKEFSKESTKSQRLAPNDKSDATIGDKGLPQHVVCHIQPDIASSQFMDIFSQAQCDEVPDTQHDGPDFILAGLHACGDLTPTLLRVFVNCPTARGLASVACCYMKMSATTLSDDNMDNAEPCLSNYPLSRFVQTKPDNKLSYEARELACHFADAYRDRLISDSPHLKVHSYRAALQKLLVTVKPDFKSGQARFVNKKGTPDTFIKYAENNVQKAGLELSGVNPELMAHCEELTQSWRRVVAFYTMRLSLAPVVESLILLDRMLYLIEQDIPCALVPIFDCRMSPRNFALLAMKSIPAS